MAVTEEKEKNRWEKFVAGWDSLWKANPKEAWRWTVRGILLLWLFCCFLGGPLVGTVFFFTVTLYFFLLVLLPLLAAATLYFMVAFIAAPMVGPSIKFLLGLDRSKEKNKNG